MQEIRDYRKLALEYINSSIASIDEKLGNDSDWTRCRRFIQRQLRCVMYDWQILPSLPYREYLETQHWKKCRKDAIERARARCQLCNNGDSILNVHHRTYESLGNEQACDLIVLCEQCHTVFHKQCNLAEPV